MKGNLGIGSRRRVHTYPGGRDRYEHHHEHVTFPSRRPSPYFAISAADGQWSRWPIRSAEYRQSRSSGRRAAPVEPRACVRGDLGTVPGSATFDDGDPSRPGDTASGLAATRPGEAIDDLGPA